MKTDTPRPIRLQDYRPPTHLIDRVDLDVSLNATRTRVRARLKMRPNPQSPDPGGPLRLDGEQLELGEIRLDRAELSGKDYKLMEAGLEITNPPDGAFTLEIVTYVNPETNKALQGLYRSRGIYCTQCEAQGFRRITYFLDRPDILSVYTCRIEADPTEAPVLLANGNLAERGTLNRGKRHYAIWKDPHPKPCYLFALVGGDLSSVASTFKTMSGRNVDLYIYIEHGKEARAHLETKYDYFVKRNAISSAEDFITKAATKSSLSGREYHIRCPNGKALTSAHWLSAELQRYRRGNGTLTR